MSAVRRRYVEPFLGGGAVLIDMLRAADPCSPEATPFLRWAGGKRKLSSEIRKRFGDYSHVDSYLVADVNADLVAAWQWIKNDVEAIISTLVVWPQTREAYINIKAQRAWTGCNQAARLVYLNLHAFNGLWRVNRRGEMNVLCDDARFTSVKYDSVAQNLRAISQLLLNAEIICADFTQSLLQVNERDICYLDSPYLPDKPTEFTSYATGLNWATKQVHATLATHVAAAARRGAKLLMSNTKAAETVYREIFDCARIPYAIEYINTSRALGNGKSPDAKRVVEEILVTVCE